MLPTIMNAKMLQYNNKDNRNRDENSSFMDILRQGDIKVEPKSNARELCAIPNRMNLPPTCNDVVSKGEQLAQEPVQVMLGLLLQEAGNLISMRI